jgi:ABC-type glycerol-3-phosphate transport system substrate-binding protein
MVVVWRRYSMRRIGLLIIIGLLLLGFTGCSVNTSNENNMEKEDEYGEIDDEVVDSADPQVEKTFYESSPSQDKDVHVINIWIPWDSYADIINLFIDTHPDFPYELRITDLHQTNFDIDWELSDTLKNNGSGRFDLPDIYIVDQL